MAIITLVSASGAPGVTTTALALAVRWPRPVMLVEADPRGGSSILAGFFKGTIDQPGLLQLVVAERQGQLVAVLPSLLLPIDGSQAHVLAGTRSHDQAVGLEGLWVPLLGVLRDLSVRTGQDVIVDGGRLGCDGTPMPLLVGSDATVLTVGSSLPAVAGARSWAGTLRERASGAVGALVVGEGRPYAAKEVARALALPLLGAVEFAPEHAVVFSEGAAHPPARGLARWRRRSAADAFAHSGYVRSVAAVGEALRVVSGTGAAVTVEAGERAS
ncbi:MAG: hypothetical protein GXX86_03000 [Propionibacterium sp.]|nr:hypothetical protein [Propionibacterium sp.]